MLLVRLYVNVSKVQIKNWKWVLKYVGLEIRLFFLKKYLFQQLPWSLNNFESPTVKRSRSKLFPLKIIRCKTIYLYLRFTRNSFKSTLTHLPFHVPLQTVWFLYEKNCVYECLLRFPNVFLYNDLLRFVYVMFTNWK